jgi:hypothetical protein
MFNECGCVFLTNSINNENAPFKHKKAIKVSILYACRIVYSSMQLLYLLFVMHLSRSPCSKRREGGGGGLLPARLFEAIWMSWLFLFLKGDDSTVYERAVTEKPCFWARSGTMRSSWARWPGQASSGLFLVSAEGKTDMGGRQFHI